MFDVFVVLEGKEFWVLSQTVRMLLQRNFWVVVLWIIGGVVGGANLYTGESPTSNSFGYRC